MALKRMVLQIGMGTDIRGADYTKAAVRALRDALWHNALSVADAVGLPVDSMQVEVTIGVPRPDQLSFAGCRATVLARNGSAASVKCGSRCAWSCPETVGFIAIDASQVRRCPAVVKPVIAVLSQCKHLRTRSNNRICLARFGSTSCWVGSIPDSGTILPRSLGTEKRSARHACFRRK